MARISKWELVVGRGLEAEPPASGGKGVWGKPPALGDFCNFLIKITNFYANLGQNSYFKAIFN